ncbi:MAG: energy-coupling factor transporter transmembrane component T [Methanothermobacter sp.]
MWGGIILDLNKVFSPFTWTNKSGIFEDISPIAKIIVIIGTTILSVMISNIWLLILIGIVFLLFIACSRTLKAALPFLSFIILFWILSIGIIVAIYKDLEYGLGFLSQFFARFFIISAVGLFFALTTSPIKFAKSLKSLKIPGEIIFTLTIALRYIPTLAFETAAIWDSLKLRVNLPKTGIIRKPYLIYRGLIIPLIIRVVKISDEVAIAAESKGFDPSRTPRETLQFNYRDFIFVIILLGFFTILKMIEYFYIMNP